MTLLPGLHPCVQPVQWSRLRSSLPRTMCKRKFPTAGCCMRAFPRLCASPVFIPHGIVVRSIPAEGCQASEYPSTPQPSGEAARGNHTHLYDCTEESNRYKEGAPRTCWPSASVRAPQCSGFLAPTRTPSTGQPLAGIAVQADALCWELLYQTLGGCRPARRGG